MKNKIYVLVLFCLISNIICSMESIQLDSESEKNLLMYALRQALEDGYWPSGVTVTLEYFRRHRNADEFEARFIGRYYGDPVDVAGKLYLPIVRRDRSAYISAVVLKNNNVTVPEQK